MTKMKLTKTTINKNRCKSASCGGLLERGWVIANHKLVSFHAAFISSVLSLPVEKLSELAEQGANLKLEVLKFMFTSWETVISLIILYLSWHIAIAIHAGSKPCFARGANRAPHSSPHSVIGW